MSTVSDSSCWRDVAMFAKFHSKSKTETIKKFPMLFKNQKNPHRKLKVAMERYDANKPEIFHNSVRALPVYGIDIDHLLKQKVVSFMRMHNNQIDNKRIRLFLVEILTLNNKTHLLNENAGSHKFGRQWVGRSLARWGILNRTFPQKVAIDDRVEFTRAEWKQMLSDTSKIIRRRANDPLPCVDRRRLTRKKVRYEDEDEEDSWVNTLPGGYKEYERLTLDDRLMVPCSVRSLCPQLQELYRLSTSNEHLQPFPLKNETLTLETSESVVQTVVVSDSSSQIFVDTAIRTTSEWDDVCDGGADFDDQDCGFELQRPQEDNEIQQGGGPERRPLFEHLAEFTQASCFSEQTPQMSFKRTPPPSRRLELDSNHRSDGAYYARASPWPAASVLLDWRVNSAGVSQNRYVDTHDLQLRLPWPVFQDRHEKSFDMFNLYAGGGAYGQRVVIHAHHFPDERGQISAPPFQFGECMPLISEGMMSTHFLRAVECTGLNLSLLAVPKSCMCLFDAAASCMYTLRSYTTFSSRQRRTKLNHPVAPPLTSFGLLRACVAWLLEDHNVLKKMDVTVTGDNHHLDVKSTILDCLCKGLEAGDPIGASLSLGRHSNERQRLLMYKKYLVDLVQAEETDLLVFAKKFFPKLNSLFTQVLCELYCEKSITVVDFVLRGVRTYTRSTFGSNNPLATRNFFLYKVDVSFEYYYGLIDNDKCMTNHGVGKIIG